MPDRPSPVDSAQAAKHVPSLDRLEAFVYRRQFQQAAGEMDRLLGALGAGGTFAGAEDDPEQQQARATRMAAAVGTLLTDPQFRLTDAGYRHLVRHHRALATLFAVTPFRNTDHLLPLLAKTAPGKGLGFPDRSALLKFLLLYSLYSGPEVDLKGLLQAHPDAVLPAVLHLLSHKVVLSTTAHERRERLLGELPPLLEAVELPDDAGDLLPALTATWMYCSYATRPDKHAIKGALNGMLRRWLERRGVKPPPLPASRTRSERPTLLVPLESFRSTHAMYRCYAPAIGTLRDRFRLVAMVAPKAIDETARGLFDEVVEVRFDPADVRSLVGQAVRQKPDMVYFPSLGMEAWTLILANLRLAPIQAVSSGHPATTGSPEIDYAILRSEALGDPACYKEALLLTHRNAFPHQMRADAERMAPEIRDAPGVIRFAIPARSIKLGPPFLEACRRIETGCNRPVEFHFFPNERGLLHSQLEREIAAWLPNARVYPTADYNAYIRNINRCDIHLSSFPFGGTNGVVDSARQALPIVNLVGIEVHTRIDKGLCQRLGYPEWLSADSPDAYVDIATTLANDDAARSAIRRELAEGDLDAALFDAPGKPGTHDLADALSWVHRNHEAVREQGVEVISLEQRGVSDTA